MVYPIKVKADIPCQPRSAGSCERVANCAIRLHSDAERKTQQACEEYCIGFAEHLEASGTLKCLDRDLIGKEGIVAVTKGEEKIRVGKGTCIVSWSEMGKKELVCALGTLMDVIEYGDKYSEMPEFADSAFKKDFESIMKALKAPLRKGAHHRTSGYREQGE